MKLYEDVFSFKQGRIRSETVVIFYVFSWIFIVILAESVFILATPTHLLDEFSSCMYNRFCNGKLVELRLKLILFLECQNQIWFQIGSTNLLFMELLAAGSLPMNQWCQTYTDRLTEFYNIR